MDNIVNLADKRQIIKAAEDDEVLCIITVRANSKVTTWLSDRVETKEQFNWLYGSIAWGSAEIVRMENKLP